jgi:hypothetical protein
VSPIKCWRTNVNNCCWTTNERFLERATTNTERRNSRRRRNRSYPKRIFFRESTQPMQHITRAILQQHTNIGEGTKSSSSSTPGHADRKKRICRGTFDMRSSSWNSPPPIHFVWKRKTRTICARITLDAKSTLTESIDRPSAYWTTTITHISWYHH